MEDAREARIVLVEKESLAMLFGEGIFRARRVPTPDLLLIDPSVRDIDAYAALRRIRNDWRLRRVPVVFLCTSPADGERAMAGNERPDAYLVKPVSRAAFAEVVRRVRTWSLRLDLPEDAAYHSLSG